MKCKHCGKLIGITRRGQRILDGYICYKCMELLGFDKSDRDMLNPLPYEYEEICLGLDRVQEIRDAKKWKHEKWLKEHPDDAAFFEYLEERDRPEEPEQTQEAGSEDF